MYSKKKKLDRLGVFVEVVFDLGSTSYLRVYLPYSSLTAATKAGRNFSSTSIRCVALYIKKTEEKGNIMYSCICIYVYYFLRMHDNRTMKESYAT